jgi:hypothetical protein
VAYTVAVQALKAGTVYFRAELTTNTLTKPLVEEESTSVLPANGGARLPAVPMPLVPSGTLTPVSTSELPDLK